MFRELTETLGNSGAVRGFSLVSHSMEDPTGDDQRFQFVMAADGLPGKVAKINLNMTKLLAAPALRDDRAHLIPTMLLAIQEDLEAGGHRHLSESAEEVLVVNVGGYE